jgi:hypothetical protein
MVPDDGEWGGDAPARKNNLGDDGEMDATELARGQESLQQHLHRQALALRLSAEDSAALRFLIESLNDDGYLEDSLEELAIGLAGPTKSSWTNWSTALLSRCACCTTWSPPVWAHAPGRMPDAAAARPAGRRRCARRVRHGAAPLRPAHGAAGAPRRETPGAGLWRQRGRRQGGDRADHAAGAQAGPALLWTWSATSWCPT